MKIGKTTRDTTVLAVFLAAAAFPAVADPAAPGGSPERTYTGQVTSVDSQGHVFSVKAWMFSQKQFNLGANCTYVMVDDNHATAADLRPGERVTVRYQVAQGVRVADRIEQQAIRSEGTVGAIDPAAHTLVLHQRGLDQTMRIANGCTVVLKNDKSGTLADLRTGDHVTVTYETPGGLPAARQIAQTSADFTGKVTAIDLDEKTIRARDTFSTMRFNLADHCAIVINGKPDGKLNQLKPDDRLVFNYETLNGVNVVDRIAPAPPEKEPNPMVTTTPGYYGYP